MSLGEIDTLNLTFDKLTALFDESQGYYETFLDTNNLYKAGKLSDKEFFQKLGDYTVAYSALEFLAIKTLMEMKKTLDKVSSGAGVSGTQSPGLMPGMGQPGTMPGMNAGPRTGTAENPVGAPPSIMGTPEAFSQPGTLPTPDPSLLPPKQSGGNCTSCGVGLRLNAKFCTKCGSKQ
jgi:hypothetical protein